MMIMIKCWMLIIPNGYNIIVDHTSLSILVVIKGSFTLIYLVYTTINNEQIDMIKNDAFSI